MSVKYRYLPAILLIEKEQSTCTPAHEWLRTSRFRTWEAMDVFDALDGISDFTLEWRPDVVIMNVESVSDTFELLNILLRQNVKGELEFPIFALADSEPGVKVRNLFAGDLSQIRAKLEEIVARPAAAASMN